MGSKSTAKWCGLVSVWILICTTSVWAVTVPGANVRLNGDPPGVRQVEPMVAVDPLDPAHLVAVGEESVDRDPDTTNVRVWVSHDGGQKWEDAGLLAGHAVRQLNPSVSFCRDGVVWAAVQDLDPPSAVAFLVYRSTDGGMTWEERTPARDAAASQDLPMLVCDDSDGPFQGRLYLRYSSTGKIFVVRSDDQAATWSDPVRVDAGGTITSNFPGEMAIGPSSEVWIGFVKNTSPMDIRTVTSFDGGVSWDPPQPVGPVDLVNATPYDYRRSSRPTLAVDRSDGSFRGGVHLVYASEPDGLTSDVLYSRHPPGPGSWLPPVILGDAPAGTNQDFPLVRVGPRGVVSIFWYDHRNDTGDGRLDVWGTTSQDAGSTFEPSFAINDSPFTVPTGAGALLGDHLAQAAWSNVFLAVWTDRRRDDGDFMLSAVRMFVLDPIEGVHVTRSGGTTTVSWTSQDPVYGEATVYDVADGSLSDLQADGGFAQAACAVSDWPDTPWDDTRSEPPAGDGRYYLLRSRTATDASSWGSSAGAAIDARVRLDVAPPCP